MNRLTHLSLFSGVGGLDIAAEWAGIETEGRMKNDILYARDASAAYYAGHTFRRTSDGYYRCYQRGAARGQLLHRVVYTTETNLSIPEGFNIHHKDHNKANNHISNLACMQASIHVRNHNSMDGKGQKCANAMREANRRLGYPGAAASREAQKANSWPTLKRSNEVKKKPICKMCNGKVEAEYPSLLDAAHSIGKPPIHISECANGKRRTAFGYAWRWSNG